jgi:hypothetical protein
VEVMRAVDLAFAEDAFPGAVAALRFAISDSADWKIWYAPATGFTHHHIHATSSDMTRVLSWDAGMRIWCTVWSTSTWLGTKQPGHLAFFQYASPEYFAETLAWLNS